MCGTIGNDSGVTIGKTSPGGGSGPSIAQNNITKVVDLGYYQPNTTDFQDKLDALNLTVLETDSPVYFRAITKLENGLLIKQLFEFTPGKGVYNPVGATTTFDDLLIIEETYPNLADIEDILLLGNVIDLGEIGTNDIVSHINSIPEIDFTDDALINYVQFLYNGLTYVYQYVGEPLIYGTTTDNTIISTNLDLVYYTGNDNSLSQETPSFQQTLNVSELGDKIKLGETILFNGGTGFFGATMGCLEIVETGKLMVYGSFVSYKGVATNRIILLNPDGSVDDDFAGNSFDNAISKIIRYNDSYIVVGAFTDYNGIPANRVIAISADGSINTDMNFGTGFNNVCHTVCNHFGTLYFGGQFTDYNGTAINRIVSINENGTIRTSFNVGTGISGTTVPQVRIIIATQGNIYVFGEFSNYNGTARNRVISLNYTGGINAAFNVGTGFNDVVIDAIVDDKKPEIIYVCGLFTTYKGITQRKIIAVDTNGTALPSFSAGTSVNGTPLSLQNVENDLLVAGNFQTYKGNVANSIIRINKTTGNKSILGSFNLLGSAFGTTLLKSNKILFTGSFNEYKSVLTIPNILITDYLGNREDTITNAKLSFNRNGNKLVEVFTSNYNNLSPYEPINKQTLEQGFATLPKYENIVLNITNSIIGSHTGDLTERVLYTFNASNLFSLAEKMAIYLNLYKNASGGNVTYRIRIGENGTTADNLAASFTAATANSRTTNLERKNCVFVTGNFLRMAAVTSSIVSDNITTGISTLIPINYSNLKISITAQLSVNTEITTLEGILITKIKK